MTLDRDITNDAMLARLEERIKGVLENLIDHRQETKEGQSRLEGRMSALEVRERERNGHIGELLHRQAAHDKWHGEEDINIAARLVALESLAKAAREEALLLEGAKGAKKRQVAFLTGIVNGVESFVGKAALVGLGGGAATFAWKVLGL